LVNPNIKLSTKEVFTQFNSQSEQILVKNKFLLDNITIYNSLLEPAIYLAPQIQSILSDLKAIPDIVTYGMSGSGSTCFGIFNNTKSITNIHKYFKDDYFIWGGKKRDYSVNRVRCSKILENKF
jgi:4-diphosphocytidyl-2-C-methyl-D-erythritol kinase